MKSLYVNQLRQLYERRELIWEMALRDLKGLNRGAFLGYIWLVLSPLIQVGAYVFIVTFVFRGRLGENAGRFDYALYVLSGMVGWQILTKTLQDSATLISQRVELLKQVIYPFETLPVSSLIAASVGTLVSLVVFAVLALFSGGISPSIVLLPIPLFLLTLFVLGFSWVFMIAGVIVKDLREIISVLLGLLVYVTPVVLSQSMVSAEIWNLILLNPLSHIVITFRDVLYGQFHPVSWVVFAGLALLAFVLGGWVINRMKLLINEYI